ncbi:hypothetical protein HanHA300_Chr13g0495771 [Helianthus annuus]|nr:hypothetical protein HanHA300_Chr13g0495771 [Helianthus annuus]KAJ0498928.1 hypothetical protein HanHA89_Chr13g0528411 [Helianthus annuus]KAJ0664943.1 hypothetical protein HanLR1_Chr13g0498441 [Helianthus annuus]
MTSSNGILSAFALVFAITLPHVHGQPFAPAPAPVSDVVSEPGYRFRMV